MSINLTFYGGINEIGGNKILLEAEQTRMFMDFATGTELLDHIARMNRHILRALIEQYEKNV